MTVQKSSSIVSAGIDCRSARVHHKHAYSNCGAPFATAQFRTWSWPFEYAFAHVNSSHGQPVARAHFSVSRRPLYAAVTHVSLSHGQPFARAHSTVVY